MADAVAENSGDPVGSVAAAEPHGVGPRSTWARMPWLRGRHAGRWLLAAAALATALGLAIEPQTVARGEQRYVIPPGTALRAKAGLPVDDVMPQHIETVVGRPLVVRNDDDEAHVIGPFVLEPGQNWRRTFAVEGDVQLACSLYPATGFTVAVAAPPTPAVRTTALLSAWLALLTLAVATAAGAAGAALGLGGAGEAAGTAAGTTEAERTGMALGTRESAGDGGSHGPVERSDEPPPASASVAPAAADAALAVAGVALGLLPALIAGAAALGLVRLARTARWVDVWGTTPMFVWAFALAFAFGAAWFGRRLGARARGQVHPAPMADGVPWSPVGDALAGVGLALLALGGAWGPLVGAWAAPVVAVATAGIGLLGAAAALAGSADHATRRRLAGCVAAPGFALLAIAMPTAPVTPPVQAVIALPKLAVALGVLWLAARQFRRNARVPAQGLLAEGSLGLLFAGGLLYGALLTHLNAVTLPIAGNPVAMSAASTERGAAVWAAECAACHGPADRATYGRWTPEALLSAMTFGKTTDGGGMPAFKYRLDVFERGDVVNYLRGGP